MESQYLPKLQNLDKKLHIWQFEWTLLNERREIFLNHRSDTKKIDHIENRKKKNTWKNNQNFQFEKEDYDKLNDFIPSVLAYEETFKNFCIKNDECTVEKEFSEIE